MKIERNPKIPDVVLLAPKVYSDNRGYFLESYRSNDLFEQLGGRGFVQGNISCSVPWTLRGIHFQTRNPQGKLVTCISGEIYDVAVDLRAGSPTFLHWVGARLSGENHQALWVPPGFGHGFLALGRGATVQYECSTEYDEAYSAVIRWNDPSIGIAWPLAPHPLDNPVTPIMSIKDQHAPFLSESTVLPILFTSAIPIGLSAGGNGDSTMQNGMSLPDGIARREIPTEEHP